jgi:hypothetical protein
MSEELTVDARLKQAKKMVAKGVEARGGLRESSIAITEKHGERFYVNSEGAVRVLGPGGNFYPATAEDPLGQLVTELYQKLPATEKAEASIDDQLGAKARLKRAGLY